MEENRHREVVRYVDVYLGSSPKVIYSVFAQRMADANGSDGCVNEHIVFDFTDKLPPELLSSLNGEITKIDRDNYIPAHAPSDRPSLEKAEKEGRMWVLDDDWLNDPTVLQDNGGGAGYPRKGYAFAVCNGIRIQEKLVKAFRRILDHIHHIESAHKGIAEKSPDARIVVRLFFSTVGAIGSGSIHRFTDDLVHKAAAEAGVEAKIVVCMLLRGNLSVQNLKKANLNQLTTLMTFRAKGTGADVNPMTGAIESIPFDNIFISSNTDNAGNIPSLERLLCHEGQMNYFLQDTPGGGSVRERFCDIQGWRYDEYGDPELGFARGIAIISRDSKRLIHYLTLRTSAILARSCLEPSDIEHSLEQSAALARRAQIVENEDENLITRNILLPEEFAGEDAREQALASFADRASQTWGLDQAETLLDAINSISGTDLGAVYEPVMKRKGSKQVEAAVEIIGQQLQQLMKRPCGLWQAQQTLRAIRAILEQASESLSEKINELQEQLQPHQEIVAEASEMVQRLRQMNLVGRALQFFTVRSMNGTLEESGRTIINCSVELSACTISLQEVVMPLIDEIDNKLGWILSEIEKLQKIEQFLTSEAEQLINQPTVFQAPVGREITDRQFLESKFDGYIERAGGLEKFQEELRLLFLNEYQSFAVLSQASMKEIIDLFCDFCSDRYRLDVKERDVLDELFTKDEENLQDIFATIVPQCDGRVRTQGQANAYIPRIKVANVPSERHVEPVVKLLESLDTNPGKWQVVVNPADKDTFSLVQVRGRITLTQFISQIDLPDTYDTWKLLVETAIDPASVLIVGPNPGDRQLRRVLAKAITSGLLEKTAEGLILQTCTGKSILLGDMESAPEKLRCMFRDIVFIESTFARDLFVHEDLVMTKLNDLLTQKQAGSDMASPLLTLIDSTAVRECIDQAKLLLPRLRRMRKAKPRQMI
jgi:hypothetical protein